MEPVNIAIKIAIASFAIDRTVTICIFLLSFFWQSLDPGSVEEEDRYDAERGYKLVYYTLASFVAAVVYIFVFKNPGVFGGLGFKPKPLLDALLTILVLLGGSERLGSLLSIPDADKASASPPPPVHVAGQVLLVPDPAANDQKAAGAGIG
jgi:hypothetical protein